MTSDVEINASCYNELVTFCVSFHFVELFINVNLVFLKKLVSLELAILLFCPLSFIFLKKNISEVLK